MSTFKLDWNEKEVNAEVRGACKKAVLVSAKQIERDAKKKVPVDNGDLKKSIEIKTWDNEEAIGAFISAGGKKLAHIAKFVELGTPGTVYKRGLRDGKRTPIKASPYMRPALRKNKNRILSNFNGAMNNG